jgi:Leucine-rich repeat (LRR) protein
MKHMPYRSAFAFLLLFVLGAVLAAGAIPESQRQALIALYNATGGDSWTYKNGWKEGELHTDGFAMPGTEGTWYGIGTDAENLNVTMVSIGGNNLTGSIPAGINALTGLQLLNFSNNALTGSIPASIGSMTSLQQIFLSYNQLSGSIPAELGNLTNLYNLYLPYNQFTGSIPASLGNLTDLQQLWLAGNQLTGSIPTELGNLTKIQLLYLQGNQLAGSIPASLGNLTECIELFLYSNALTGEIPPELGNLTKLQRIWLTGNGLTGPIPSEVGNWAAIRDIQFGGNQLSGSLPASLGNLTTLTSLSVYSNQLTGPIPPELGNMTALSVLFLSSNQLSGTIPTALGNLTNLTNLSIGNNNLTGSIPAEIGALVRLNTLDVRINQLSGVLPGTLGDLTALRYLYLNGNKFAGPVPAAMANLTLLSYTDLAYNAFYSSDPSLVTFLNAKDPDWASTQTVAPVDIIAEAIDGAGVRVSWTPIAFTALSGYYRIYHAQTEGGPYGLAGQTADKSASTFDVTGLNQGQTYYFVVQAHTDPHQYNYYKNSVDSEYSAEVSAVPWLQVEIAISGTVMLGGAPLPNVLMAGLPGGPVTDAAGVYQATVPAGWSGTVTPDLADHTFVPASRTYTTLQEDQTAQDFSATFIGASITVTAPNGGESWPAGATRDVTWSQSGLTGTVTVDLYKGGVFQKTLGTPEAAAGTFSWAIGAGETPGADYRILVWQGGISDGSDGDFTIAPAGKEDFVGTWDGQGVYYRNSDTGGWVRLASPATMITAGDLDGDSVDDLIGLWPSQGGIWVRYAESGAWARLSSTARYITAGDMNGDGRVDLVGTWDGQGVFYRDSMTGAWVRMASEATMVAAGDIDGDGADDLLGLWPAQGGIWVKYSQSGLWARLSSTAVHIAAGDMDGDGRVDLVGTWDGQGVYYRNSIGGAWVRMASPATLITAGDIDGDAVGDLIGIWPAQGGVWVKYSESGAWSRLSSTAQDISAGVMRASAPLPAPRAAEGASDELPLPMGGRHDGPDNAAMRRDLADDGPGGRRFVYLEAKDPVPSEGRGTELMRAPGPGDPGFNAAEQPDLVPGERVVRRGGREGEARPGLKK